MPRVRRVLQGLGAALVVLLAVAFVRTVRLRPATTAVPPVPRVTIPTEAAERLAGAVRFPTVSHEDPAAFDADAFRGLHAYLQASFPRAHAALRREVVGSHSLLYTWPGRDSTLKPILILAHQDVVPVEPGTEGKWQEDPFAGRIVGGFIWGRGAIDNKSAVLGTLEAAEMLLAEGFRPQRTILLAYGHDEEVGGSRGAREIAALLRSRGVALHMVVDEGGVIGDGLLRGVTAPVALVGVAEKGFATIELTARTAGGHSSLPPRENAIGILGAAVARLEANPLPARLEGPTAQLFERLAPSFPFAQRAVFANLWLARPLVMRTLTSSPTTNAMVRTTTAVTVFQAGTKDNVLPSRARALVNFRIHPGDSVAGVWAHVRRVVADSRVEARVSGRFSAEPSAVSRTDSEAFRTLERVVRSVVPGVRVAPYLVVVVTDSRYFADLCPNVFRFLPLRLGPEDLGRMHGTDERIAIRDYEQAIRTYRQLMVDAAGREP